MKTNKIVRFALTAALTCTAFFAQAQNYVALYEDNTYKVIDQPSLDELLIVKKHDKALPVVVFEISNKVSNSTTARPAGNGAGTRLAGSQASIKPGLKSTTTNTFDMLCDCSGNFYARAVANTKDTDCKTNCKNTQAAIDKEIDDLRAFFLKDGIEIDYDSKKDKEKAKSKAPKASK